MTRPVYLSARLELQHDVVPALWGELGGVELWGATLTIDDGEPRRSARVAALNVARLDLNECAEPVYELDSLDADLGYVAAGLSEKEEMLLEFGVAGGMNTVILIGDLMVVDPYWRGHRIGPALLDWVAHQLRSEFIFLAPADVPTRRDPRGHVIHDFDRPRGGPEGLAKVRKVWRRAGYRKLTDTVVWKAVEPDHTRRAVATLVGVDALANTPQGRRWWRGRVKAAQR